MSREQATTVATYAASAGSFVAGMTANELAAVAGICIAALTMLLNWWYQHQRLRMERERTNAHIRMLERRRDLVDVSDEE